MTERLIGGERLRCINAGDWRTIDGYALFEDGRRGWTWKLGDGAFPDQQVYENLSEAVRGFRAYRRMVSQGLKKDAMVKLLAWRFAERAKLDPVSDEIHSAVTSVLSELFDALSLDTCEGERSE